MLKIISNDVHNGTRHNIYKFVIIFAFTIMACMMLRYQAELKSRYGAAYSVQLGIVDYVINMFGGMKCFTVSESSRFEVPLPWMTIQLLISSCVFSYVSDNMRCNGRLLLMLSGTRTGWWAGKYIWAVSQVIIAYLCILAGCIVAALAAGTFNNADGGLLHRDIIYAVAGVRIINEDSIAAGVVLSNLIYPFVCNIAIVLVQMTLQLFINPIASLAVVIAYNISSLFITSPFLICNMAMLYRNANITASGIAPSLCVIPAIAGTALVCAAGIYEFKRKDIL